MSKEDDQSPSEIGIWVKEKGGRAFFIPNAVEKKDGEKNGVTLFLRNHEIVRTGSAADDGGQQKVVGPLFVVNNGNETARKRSADDNDKQECPAIKKTKANEKMVKVDLGKEEEVAENEEEESVDEEEEIVEEEEEDVDEEEEIVDEEEDDVGDEEEDDLGEEEDAVEEEEDGDLGEEEGEEDDGEEDTD
jgi:hypothetical protein